MSGCVHATVGVLGGSFNPVHNGHLNLACRIIERGFVDKVLLMLSPQNPLKVNSGEMASDADRLAMLRIATTGLEAVEACDIELSMPRPSYSIDSLSLLSRRWPDVDFRLIIGSDNWVVMDRWKDYKEIVGRFRPIVYPRPGYNPLESPLGAPPSIVEAPLYDISSTRLREAIKAGENLGQWLAPGVEEYIRKNRLYIK